MKKAVLYVILYTLFFTLCPLSLNAQCPMQNTAFNAGETLDYDLHFNWGIIWIKVGTAKMTVRDTLYTLPAGMGQGKRTSQPAYTCDLLTRTGGKAEKFFRMRDTLRSVVTHDIVPLYYRKGANEGGQYRVDEVWYSYPGNGTHMKQRYRNASGKVTTCENTSIKCVYDMVSMLMRARSFDGSKYKKGDRINFLMADGDEVEPQTLVFRGKKEFKMDGTGTRYRCLVFSFVEKTAKGKDKEVITFYVTDDDNHLPVRLDLYLRFGTAKAFLTNATGIRNPQTSIIK